MTGSLVLLSGGLDSAAAIHWALENMAPVAAVGFDYMQRHGDREIGAAREIAAAAGVPFHVRRCADVLHRTGPLAGQGEPILSAAASVVPSRNLLFLAMAAAVRGGADMLVVGCTLDDAADYPDCRPEFLDAAAMALRASGAPSLVISAPWVRSPKCDVVRWAHERPDAWRAIGMSWSCYEGRRTPCGLCPACVVRARAFAHADLKDPAL